MVKHFLDPLLCPRSVALVGASDKPDRPGSTMIKMSRIDGFDGKIFPVNPRINEIDNSRCYPDLASLPEIPEHVVIGVASRFVEDILDQAIDLGIRAATIFAACYLDNDSHPALPKRIAAKASASGMSVCGANCMGFYNPSAGLRIASAASPAGLQKGGIAWIAQSGSTFGALTHNDRRLGFCIAVSTGMELVTGVADYMDWALAQPETRVIGLFIETIRDPAGFVKALEAAREKNIPVVALKVGRTPKSAQMALSHTGAIAGNDAAYEAVFRAYGVHRVADMDEMAATLAFFDTPRKTAPGNLGVIQDSGGEREMVVDLAEDHGIVFAGLEPATCKAIAGHLEPGLVAENPLDAFGTHNTLEDRLAEMIALLVNDPNVGLGLYMSDPRDDYAYTRSYTAAVMKAAKMTAKPLAMVSHYSMTDERKTALRLKQADVPLLRGTVSALLAAKHLMADAAYRSKSPQPNMKPPAPDAAVKKWRTRLMEKAQLPEAEGLAMLTDFGIPVPKTEIVSSPAELKAALAGFRFPLVIKTAANHAHKSDVGGVRLNITDTADALAAYEEMSSRLGKKALLMEMAGQGMELSLGAIHDESFGPVVVIAAGGVLMEYHNDRIAALPPFDAETARGLIAELRISRLLHGYRGAPAVDMDALASSVARFSAMVAALGDAVREMDINPLICNADGITAVDCLVAGKAAPC